MINSYQLLIHSWVLVARWSSSCVCVCVFVWQELEIIIFWSYYFIFRCKSRCVKLTILDEVQSPSKRDCFWTTQDLRRWYHRWVEDGTSLKELGKTKRLRKNWIFAEILIRYSDARDAILYNSPNHYNGCRNATRSSKSDRKRYWHEFADQIETSAVVGGFEKLFRLIRSSSANAQHPPSTFRDGSDNCISECEQKLQIWFEQFSSLLSRPPIQHVCLTLPGDIKQY